MKKLYRIEVSTLWRHREINHVKWRDLVYNFKTGELDVNQRTWQNGQNFLDPKHSPEIYAEKDTAVFVYDELDAVGDEWPPLSDIIVDGGREELISFQLIAVDPNGSETVEAEFDAIGFCGLATYLSNT